MPEVDLRIIREAMPLVFKQYGSKWYAETPSGEYAFGDNQGLYEWRRIDGQLERIDHTGGDRSHVVNGQLAHTQANPGPKLRGIYEALDPKRRLN